MRSLAATITVLLCLFAGYSYATDSPSSAPTSLLGQGYYYVQVYSADTCASSDSDIQYVSGYYLNTCLTQYNTSGSPVGSFEFTCSTDDVFIRNYTSIDCNGISSLNSFPIDTCFKTNNTDFTDGISYGLSYAHRCVNQNKASSVSQLPIHFDAVTTTGYDNSLCSGGNLIQTFSASAINLCFNAPNKNFYGEFSCDANSPEVTQYNSTDATCPAGSGTTEALPTDCSSVSDVSSYFPTKSNWLSSYYKSTCNLQPTMKPTAVPNSAAPSPASTHAPTYFSDSQGYVYKQYYLDSGCKENSTVHYTGYATGICLVTYASGTDVPDGSQSYGVCSATSTTANVTSYLSDYNCTSDGTEQITTITLNSCMSEPLFSGTQYYKWKCTDSLSLPVTHTSVVINTYTSTCDENPVAFSAFVEDQCIDHYGDSGNSSASYSCDTDEGNVPVKTYYVSSQECSGKSKDFVLPQECTAQYTYDSMNEESSSSSSYYYYMYSYYNYDVEDIGLFTQAYCYKGTKANSNDHALTSGAVAGVVIGVLVIISIATFFAYRQYQRRVTEKSLREILNTNASNTQYPKPGSGHHEDIIIEENRSKNPMQL